MKELIASYIAKFAIGFFLASVMTTIETGLDFLNELEGPALASGTSPRLICASDVRLSQRDIGIANIIANVSCSLGRATEMRISVFHTSLVNNPDDSSVWRQIRTIRVNCLTTNCSLAQSFAQDVDRTKYLRVVLNVTAIDVDGRVVSSEQPSNIVRVGPGTDTWVYNDEGRAYPRVTSPRFASLRGSWVPFPLLPYLVCPGDPACSPPRTSTLQSRFRQELVNLYNQRGFSIPAAPYQAHHIKPLEWGGSWDSRVNGVLLGDSTHSLFTNWWKRRGVSGAFNPVSF